MTPFERLEAWKRAHQVVLMTYRVTATWPQSELYGLTSQTRRAASSIPLNIAEGAARRGSRESRRFLDIALGSCSALAYCLLLAKDLEDLTLERWQEIEALRDDAGQLT